MGKIVVLCLLVGAITSIGACFSAYVPGESFGFLTGKATPGTYDWNAGTLAALFIGLALMVVTPISFMVFRSANQERAKQADHFYNKACTYSLSRDMDRCFWNLVEAISLDPSCREKAKQDESLEWARNDPRVRKILGLASDAKPRD